MTPWVITLFSPSVMCPFGVVINRMSLYTIQPGRFGTARKTFTPTVLIIVCMAQEDGDFLLDIERIPTWAFATTAESLDGEIPGLQCNACNHKWPNRVDQPSECPNCQTALRWDVDDDDDRMIPVADLRESYPGVELSLPGASSDPDHSSDGTSDEPTGEQPEADTDKPLKNLVESREKEQ